MFYAKWRIDKSICKFKDSNRFAFGDICLTFINYVVYYKLRRDDLTEKELCDIADILNCDYDGIFTFRDIGKQVWLPFLLKNSYGAEIRESPCFFCAKK